MRHIKKFLKISLEKIKIYRRKILIIFALILFSLIPAFLLLMPGFPVTDDGTWLIIRFSAFYETLRLGQIPVRFIYRLNDGMGYPVSNFLYPLYLYLAVPIHVLGFSFLNSIKMLLIINIFLSSIFTFFWLNKKFNDTSSLLGAVALVISPYYLFDLYKRGSVGELLTFSIVPFILWQLERRSFIFLSIGFFLLLLSHNTLGFLFLLLIFFYVLANRININPVIKSFILGMGMSAFFWIPAIGDLNSTVFLATKVSNFYNYLFTAKEYYLIGFSGLMIIFTSTFLIISQKRLRKEIFLISSLIISLIIIFLQFPISAVIWEFFPFRDFIQFPFRLLSVLVILLSFQAAFSSENLKINKWIFPTILIIILFFQGYIFLNKITFQKYDDTFYSTNESTTTVSNEYLTKWYKNLNESKLDKKIEIISGEGKILDDISYPRKLNFAIENQTPVELRINILYFPGWEAIVNNETAEISYENDGLIGLSLSPGKNRVILEFQETKIRYLANFISLISLFIFIGYGIKHLKFYKNSKSIK